MTVAHIDVVGETRDESRLVETLLPRLLNTCRTVHALDPSEQRVVQHPSPSIKLLYEHLEHGQGSYNSVLGAHSDNYGIELHLKIDNKDKGFSYPFKASDCKVALENAGMFLCSIKLSWIDIFNLELCPKAPN